MAIKTVDQECGSLGDFLAGLLTEEGEAYERRIQNLSFYAKRRYSASHGYFDGVEFTMSVDGPFSEQIRNCLEELTADPEVIVKVDISRGVQRKRYVSRINESEFDHSLVEFVREVLSDTTDLSTDELVRLNINEGRGDLPESNQEWMDLISD